MRPTSDRFSTAFPPSPELVILQRPEHVDATEYGACVRFDSWTQPDWWAEVHAVPGGCVVRGRDVPRDQWGLRRPLPVRIDCRGGEAAIVDAWRQPRRGAGCFFPLATAAAAAVALLLLAATAQAAEPSDWTRAAPAARMRVATYDGDLPQLQFRATLRPHPSVSVELETSSRWWTGTGLVFDARPFEPVRLRATAHVWLVRTIGLPWEPEGRADRLVGDVSIDVGCAFSRCTFDGGELREASKVAAWVKLATQPSAELWGSTANPPGRRPDDFGWFVGGGVSCSALVDWRYGIVASFAVEAGAFFDAAFARNALLLRADFSLRWMFAPGWMLAAGVFVEPAAGVRISGLDLRSVTPVAQFFAAVELHNP